MLNALWFMIKTTLLVAAVVWLSKDGGHVDMIWHGYQIETSPGFMLASVLVLLVLWTVIYRVWRAVVTLPRQIGRRNDAVRREQGYESVTRGLVAIAAGDARGAQKYTRKAQGLLPNAPLTRLLTAQNALVHGNRDLARTTFLELMDDGDAAFLGLRGLLSDAMARHDHTSALAYLRKADALQPGRAWILAQLFDIETRTRHWIPAHKVLVRAEKSKAFTAPQARRHRQALFLAQSIEAEGRGDRDDARRFAGRAYAVDPSFPPAAAAYARLLRLTDKRRAAAKTVLKGWKLTPHPALRDEWMLLEPVAKKITSVYDAGRPHYAWMQSLVKSRLRHPESQRALGLAALQGKLWREAREHFKETDDQHGLGLLAAAERGHSLPTVYDGSHDGQWTCSACGTQVRQWQPLCPQCGAFNRMIWAGEDVFAQSPAALYAHVTDILAAPAV